MMENKHNSLIKSKP